MSSIGTGTCYTCKGRTSNNKESDCSLWHKQRFVPGFFGFTVPGEEVAAGFAVFALASIREEEN